MVRVEGVSRAFGDTLAVDDASFTLERGRFLTILGPSGSGKTTLLRMIAGFLTPTRGEIYVAGAPVSRVPAHRRSIGMVFQRLALFPHMTVAQNVAYPLKMRRFDPRTIPERVQRYLSLVRLDGFGDRRIQELSGGQQQRVAIARALVFEPVLLLLDEPLAALDRKLREDMQLEFRRIQQELGVTTINVTHDQREALVMSDDIVVMDGGRVQQKAAPIDIYRRPGNRFVAGFIGVTNMLRGRVVALSGGRAAVRIADATLSAAAAQAGALVGREVDFAIRAEQVRLARSGAALPGLDTVLEGRVSAAIFEGDRLVYEVACPALGGQTLRAFAHDPLQGEALAVGEPVSLGWTDRDPLLFAA
ncbi:MAG: ABC transporter ATP-binding protein [Rhodospirillaceae bacterium]|nr:ABC transporter ATP-binding protein [Rhodospirillaceae bacterium]